MKLGICIPHYGRPIEVERMLTVVGTRKRLASTRCG